jgi:hypothetical protein
MAQSWFSDPELLATNFSVSYVCNNLTKLQDTLVRIFASLCTRKRLIHLVLGM